MLKLMNLVRKLPGYTRSLILVSKFEQSREFGELAASTQTTDWLAAPTGQLVADWRCAALHTIFCCCFHIHTVTV